MSPCGMSSHGLELAVLVPLMILPTVATASELSTPRCSGAGLNSARSVPAASALLEDANAPFRGAYILMLVGSTSLS